MEATLEKPATAPAGAAKPLKKIVFYGHSDDIIYAGEQGKARQREFKVDSANSPAACFTIMTPAGEAALVFAHYSGTGCWYFGLGRLVEGQPLPAWRVSIGTDDKKWNGYTTVFIIEVPEDAKLMRLTTF